MYVNSLTLLLLALLTLPAASYADRVAFGSFGSAQNAQNWAAKLSALFDHEMAISEIDAAGQTLFRVTSQNLSTQAYTLMTRKAAASGIRYWRIGETRDNLSSRVEKPLGAARIVPPSPPVRVEEPRVDSQTTVLAPESNAAPDSHHMEWDLGVQSRLFAKQGDFGQDRAELSVSAQFEYFRGWRNDTRSVTFTPFVRLDSADNKRTHADVRELFYSHVEDAWDVHVGAKRVFWGVTEFHHLIDVVNQTDLVENIDTEDKLGQPMVQFSTVRDWGVLDIYALLGFRERTYPGEDGRLRLPFKVLDDADYESGAENLRTDFALRWSHFAGPFEFGLHHFSGTSRDPFLNPELNAAGDLVLRPYYPVIDQTGIDAQAFYGDWAFKLEGFSRSGYGDRYAAANIGIERTLVGVFGSRADLGLVAEYLFDERDEAAVNTLFEHDIALGGRFSLNDFADSKALIGVIFDTKYDDYIVSLEASRRLGNDWLLSIEGRVFAGGENIRANLPASILLQNQYKSAWLQQDDYLQVEFKKFL